jgi:hypothetical protein
VGHGNARCLSVKPATVDSAGEHIPHFYPGNFGCTIFSALLLLCGGEGEMKSSLLIGNARIDIRIEDNTLRLPRSRGRVVPTVLDELRSSDAP